MGSAVSLGTTVGGNVMGKKSANNSRRRLEEGYNRARDLTNEGFGDAEGVMDSSYSTAIDRLNPYADLGEGALGKLAYGLGFDVPDMEGKGVDKGSLLESFSAEKFKTDPGYEFARSEGNRAIERGASSRGQLLSGATLKALNKFNTGLANQQYGDAYERYNKDRQMNLNSLSTMGAQGQTAARAQGGFDEAYGLNKSSLITDKFDKLSGLELGRAGAKAQSALAKGRYAQNSMGAIGNEFDDTMGDLASTVGLMAAFSDRKLKSNIKRIGTHPLGIGIYKYLIFGDEAIGVMSDEVRKVMPEAVSVHKESGYDMVDYGMIGGV
jgi:hypothetical protein